MSYILDALKKSSEERRKHEAEREITFQGMEEEVHHRKKRSAGTTMLLFLFLAIITAASVTGSWLFFAVHKTPEKMQDISGTMREPDDAGIAGSPPNHEPPAPKTQTITQTAALPHTPEPDSPGTTETLEPKLTIPEPEPRKEAMPLLEDLPIGMQSAIPEMKFSGHVYSQQPSLRMIMINADVVREKEMVATDLHLLEITENGLIMEFKGNRFRIELF